MISSIPVHSMLEWASGLQYHPDRNMNDPMASANFIQISKAYKTLTDEVELRSEANATRTRVMTPHFLPTPWPSGQVVTFR